MLLNKIQKENLFKQLSSVKLLSTQKWIYTVVNSKYVELCMIWKSTCICACECVCNFHYWAWIYSWRSIVNTHLFCLKYGTLENAPELITNMLVIIKNANELLGYFLSIGRASTWASGRRGWVHGVRGGFHLSMSGLRGSQTSRQDGSQASVTPLGGSGDGPLGILIE